MILLFDFFSFRVPLCDLHTDWVLNKLMDINEYWREKKRERESVIERNESNRLSYDS